MVYDGLGYLIVLSAANVFNLLIYFRYTNVELQDVQVSSFCVL
jgi:hypothetical protein